MAFVFKLEQLLKIAVHEEGEVKKRLAVISGQIDAELAEAKKAKDEYDKALLQKETDLINCNMKRVQMYGPYLIRLLRQEEWHKDEAARHEKRREKIIEELKEKQKKRRTYEKIREKDEMIYKKEQQKKEQKNLDEFAGRKKSLLEGNTNA